MKFKKLLLFLGTVSIFVLNVNMLAWALDNRSVKITIVPFKIHSEKDLSFLRNGIQNMLATRLTRDERVKLSSRTQVEEIIAGLSEPLTRQNADLIGKRLGSDYVVIGNLTVFGESVSTDAAMIDVETGKSVLIFNQSGESRGDVIPHINMLSSEILDKLFGPATKPEVKSVISPPVLPARSGDGELDFLKSRKFDLEIMSLAMGDVDGDGQVELVFVSQNDVIIYRYTAGRFVKVSEINEKSYNSFIRVDVGDINRNGKAEIFITNLSRTSSLLNSLVMEWDGNAYRKIVTKQNDFYRVIRTQDRGDLLLGQKYNKQNVFEKGVYELIWNGDQYDIGNRYNVPSDKNIYEFEYGDPLHKGHQVITYFSNTDRIRILNETGDQEWESEDKYGGNYTYIEYHDEVRSDDQDRYYFPQRIFVTDFDNSGKDDLIVVKNKDTSSRVFERFRRFRLGYLECLTWKGLGFELMWRTQQISGYISDYGVADIDGDGKKELVCAVVEKKDALVSKPKSYFVVWNKIESKSADDTEEMSR